MCGVSGFAQKFPVVGKKAGGNFQSLEIGDARRTLCRGINRIPPWLTIIRLFPLHAQVSAAGGRAQTFFSKVFHLGIFCAPRFGLASRNLPRQIARRFLHDKEDQ
jgi:hypothetical protein